MKTVKHLLVSMLVFSIASSPILAGGPDTPTTPSDSGTTSAPAGTPSGSDTPTPDSDTTELTVPADPNANSGVPQTTEPAAEDDLSKPAKSSGPITAPSTGNNNYQYAMPSNPDMQQLKTELAKAKEEIKRLTDKSSKDSDTAFEMPFFSPNTVTKPVYNFFKNQHDKNPKTVKGISFVTCAIAATFLIGKGMEHTNAFMKKVAKGLKPKHKETEKLIIDLATKSAIVVLGLTGALGLKWMFNGFAPVPAKS